MAFNLVLWKKDTELYILSSTFPKNLKQLSLQHIEYEYIYIYTLTHPYLYIDTRLGMIEAQVHVCFLLSFSPPPKPQSGTLGPSNLWTLEPWQPEEMIWTSWFWIFEASFFFDDSLSI